MGVYAKPSEIAFLRATNVRRTVLMYLGNVCLCVCVSYVLQCNLSEAGMWVSVAAALRGETAAGYCLCTCCRGNSLAKYFFTKMQSKAGPSLLLRFAFF